MTPDGLSHSIGGTEKGGDRSRIKEGGVLLGASEGTCLAADRGISRPQRRETTRGGTPALGSHWLGSAGGSSVSGEWGEGGNGDADTQHNRGKATHKRTTL